MYLKIFFAYSYIEAISRCTRYWFLNTSTLERFRPICIIRRSLVTPGVVVHSLWSSQHLARISRYIAWRALWLILIIDATQTFSPRSRSPWTSRRCSRAAPWSSPSVNNFHHQRHGLYGRRKWNHFLLHNTSSQKQFYKISSLPCHCNALVRILLTVASIYGQVVTPVPPVLHAGECMAIIHDRYVTHLRTLASCHMETYQWKE